MDRDKNKKRNLNNGENNGETQNRKKGKIKENSKDKNEGRNKGRNNKAYDMETGDNNDYIEEKPSVFSIVLKVLLGILAVFILIVLCYVAYVIISYERIEDNVTLDVISYGDTGNESVTTGEEYTIGTYNVGFGAYTPTYSFFMDGGEYSRAYSDESATEAITGAAKLAMTYDPDFMLFEEVDRDATRSWHVNEEDLISDIFDGYYETFAVNYNSAYLFYPFDEPIGASYSGIALYSKYEITSSLRRSLPISTSFSKFLDLDRCYSINRIDVDNGKELVIFNVHLSAYGNSDEIREAQVSMLIEDMNAEIEAGNYVICGGDFNHDLKADESSTEECESWAYPFPRSELPDSLMFAMDNLSENELDSMTDSCRDTGDAYDPETTYVVTLDGFIISDNITMTDYEIVNSGYAYSDHEPVIMKFILN